MDTDIICDNNAACPPIVVNITRAWAPLGADHIHELVTAKYFDDLAFFRVVPDFVVQFGISGDPDTNKKWSSPIKDDPVLQSNKQGTLVFATAGPNTRTTQLFINYKDNGGLDAQGFAPFGVIDSGFETATKVFNPTPGNSGGIDQDEYTTLGNAWLKPKYPKANFITKTTVL
jgi:peptidyl-prolyl cis-trans isomerase A (cyclophilin A)